MSVQESDISQWSTGTVAPADRFAYWRETLSANLIGDTPDALPEYQNEFEGSVTRVPVGDTAVMQMRIKLAQLRTHRSKRDIIKSPGDGIFLFRPINLPLNFIFPDREGVVAQPQRTVIGGLDRERFSVPFHPGEYRVEVLRLGATAFKGVVDAPEILEPRLLEHATGADSLLDGFFQSFMGELSRLDSTERAAGLTTLTNLVTLVLRRERKGDEPVRDAVRAARLQAVKDYIARHAARPDLSPATVAATLRISTRQLQSLFETSGKTFTQHVAGERIARAVQALEFDSVRTVAQIAFDCGFNSLPTFYRTFRSVTGTTPTELRLSRIR